jgi:hypothetical protein
MPTAAQNLFLKYSQEMKILLEKDAELFKNNRINELIQSNEEKNRILGKLAELIQNDFHHKLRPAELAEITLTIQACQKLMAINGPVVHANLYRLKWVIDKALGKDRSSTNTYDDKGRIK